MQSLFGGMTSYDEQSVTDILEDINQWIDYTEAINKEMNERYEKAVNCGFWKKVGCDFQLTIIASMRYYNTIISDLALVVNDIRQGCVMEKHVNLLKKIGVNACQYNNEYPKTFKNDLKWHDYGNSEFDNVEMMYNHGRDFFVTLQDAVNAAIRLEDYMEKGMKIVNNSVEIRGDILESNIQVGVNNSNQELSISSNNVDYEGLLNTLEKIQKITSSEMFVEEFADHADEVKELIESAIDATKRKEQVSVLKSVINKVIEFTKNVSAGVIATGIYTQLMALPFLK